MRGRWIYIYIYSYIIALYIYIIRCVKITDDHIMGERQNSMERVTIITYTHTHMYGVDLYNYIHPHNIYIYIYMYGAREIESIYSRESDSNKW